jgi:hypothetical protein
MIRVSEQAESGLRGDTAARHGAGLWPPISAAALGRAAAAAAPRIRAFGGHLELPAPAALGAVLMVGTLTKGNYPPWAFAAVGACYLGYVVRRCVLARGDAAPPQASGAARSKALPDMADDPAARLATGKCFSFLRLSHFLAENRYPLFREML